LISVSEHEQATTLTVMIWKHKKLSCEEIVRAKISLR